MKGLVEKPHFDGGVFKPGTPVFVDIPREPFQKGQRFMEHCLVTNVDKDRMTVSYVKTDSYHNCNSGYINDLTILAEDVANGKVKIKFMKSIDEEEGK